MLFAFTDVPPELRPMTAAWLAFLGACIGSFLNVVVYRLPRRLNLVFPASACPACGHAIRWYHNVPIVGWLVLRGRCKDCRAPISARYPLVETAVGAIFLVLALAGPLSPRVEAVGRVNFNNDWIGAVRWAAYPYHLLLVCGLVALVLIEGDAGGGEKDEGGRMKDESSTGGTGNGGATFGYPWGLFLFVLVVGILGPLGWLVAPLFGESGVVLDGDTLAHVKGALVDRGLGVAAAWLVGPALRPAVRIASAAPRPARWAVGNLMLLGAYLGLQAVCVVAAVAALFYLLATLVAHCRPAWVWSAWLVPIGVLWIVIGYDPSLLGGEGWLGLPAPFVLAAGSLGVAVLLSIATWAICGRSLN